MKHKIFLISYKNFSLSNKKILDKSKSIKRIFYFNTDSGVHGALVVLEPSFTGDTMATALGIPPAKQMIRRHLTAELEALVVPARYSVYYHPEATLDNAH